MEKEQKEKIIQYVKTLYLTTDLVHQDPYHGMMEMNRILEILRLKYVDEE